MISINNQIIKKEYFPDNTLRIRALANSDNLIIEWLYENDEELAWLYFLTKHIKSNYSRNPIILKMPYIPNARMDRVKNKDEVFTLKYFAEFINDLHFDKVIVRDPHSYVSLALINNIECEDIKDKILSLTNKLLTNPNDIIFYPDEGASKRYSDMIGNSSIFGIKKRNFRTGQIEDLEVVGDVPQGKFNALIIDDICSYGGTFYHSAKKLKQLGADKIYLYVTHCENNILKGELLKDDLIEKVFTTKSIFTQESNKIEII